MSSEYDLVVCQKCDDKFDVEKTISNCLSCYNSLDQEALKSLLNISIRNNELLELHQKTLSELMEALKNINRNLN